MLDLLPEEEALQSTGQTVSMSLIFLRARENVLLMLSGKRQGQEIPTAQRLIYLPITELVLS